MAAAETDSWFLDAHDSAHAVAGVVAAASPAEAVGYGVGVVGVLVALMLFRKLLLRALVLTDETDTIVDDIIARFLYVVFCSSRVRRCGPDGKEEAEEDDAHESDSEEPAKAGRSRAQRKKDRRAKARRASVPLLEAVVGADAVPQHTHSMCFANVEDIRRSQLTHSALLGEYWLMNATLALTLPALAGLPLTQGVQDWLYLVLTCVGGVHLSLVTAATIGELMHDLVQSMRMTDLKSSSFRHASLFIRGIVWSLGALFVLSHLGYDVSVLMTGFGYSGLLVGLALQATFKDLFGSLTLLLDRPFGVDDYVEFGDTGGTVLSVGFRSTMIRRLDAGEVIHVPNSTLAAQSIANQAGMKRRRVKVSLQLSHETTVRQLEDMPALVEDVVNGVPNCRYKQCHLLEIHPRYFGVDYTFNVLKTDTKAGKDARHAVSLELLRRFEAEGIHLAKPWCCGAQ